VGSQQDVKPTEILAAAVFQFVNTANSLGEILGPASRNGLRPEIGYGESTDSLRRGQNLEDDAENTRSEDEVQLLRLRLKHQEVIIFPDPNYICCVVQRLGKPGGSQDRR
jgi:hypothetical protein